MNNEPPRCGKLLKRAGGGDVSRDDFQKSNAWLWLQNGSSISVRVKMKPKTEKKETSHSGNNELAI